MSTSVASRYSHDSAPCGTADSRKLRAVKRLPTSLPSMSTRASTTVSTALSLTARSSASIVKDAWATSPLANPWDAFRVRTSVTAHLQYQLASHATALEALVSSTRLFERKSLGDRHLESPGSNQLRDLLERVAVGFHQRRLHAHSAPLHLRLELAVRAARHREQESARTNRCDELPSVGAADQVQRYVGVARPERLTVVATCREDASAERFRDLDGQVPHAAAGAVHQHGLALADLGGIDEALPRRQRGEGKRRRLDGRNRFGDAGEVPRWRGDVLRVRPGGAWKPRHAVDHIALLEAGYAVAHGFDHAAHVPTRDERRRSDPAGHPFASPRLGIDRVDACRDNADQHLGRDGRRHLRVGADEHLGASEACDLDRPHPGFRWSRGRRS